MTSVMPLPVLLLIRSELRCLKKVFDYTLTVLRLYLDYSLAPPLLCLVYALAGSGRVVAIGSDAVC